MTAATWKRIAPLSGVVFVGLIVASIMISDGQPGAGDGPAKVAAYFPSHHGRTNAQIVLLAYAALFAAVYFTSVAHYLRERGSQTMATLIIAGGVFAGVGAGLAAGTSAAIGETTKHFNPGQLQVLNALSEDLFWPLMVLGVVLATLATGVAILRTKALPKALGIVTVVVGVVGISGIGSWFGFMGSGVIILVVAGYVVARSGRPVSIEIPETPAQRANADHVTPSGRKASTKTKA